MGATRTRVLSTRLEWTDAAMVTAAAAIQGVPVSEFLKDAAVPNARRTVRDAATDPAER